MIRLSDLRDKLVRSTKGEMIGRVHEVHCNGGKITELKCGPASWIERMTSREHGSPIPWESVRKIEGDAIIVER